MDSQGKPRSTQEDNNHEMSTLFPTLQRCSTNCTQRSEHPRYIPGQGNLCKANLKVVF